MHSVALHKLIHTYYACAEYKYYCLNRLHQETDKAFNEALEQFCQSHAALVAHSSQVDKESRKRSWEDFATIIDGAQRSAHRVKLCTELLQARDAMEEPQPEVAEDHLFLIFITVR